MALPARGARHDELLPDLLRAIRDGLRGGLSLTAAVVRTAEDRDSPTFEAAAQLRAGRPAPDALADAAATASSRELALALLVLSVHARTGGDPARAISGLESRIRARVRASREVRALTTQARLSARTILLLTPGFMALLAVLDPAGTWRTLTAPGSALAVGAGLLLQGLGALWVSRIIRAPTEADAAPRPKPVTRALDRCRHVPVLRALITVVAPAPASSGDDVAYAADLTALLLGAGLSPSRAMEAAAPVVPGSFGEALRAAGASVRAGAPRGAALQVLGRAGPEARRFSDAFAASDRLGVPLAEGLRSLADDLLEARTGAVSEAVRAASVKVLLPLGLLILPAFVLACLIPLFLNGLQGIRL